jgi:hypothetical protein
VTSLLLAQEVALESQPFRPLKSNGSGVWQGIWGCFCIGRVVIDFSPLGFPIDASPHCKRQAKVLAHKNQCFRGHSGDYANLTGEWIPQAWGNLSASAGGMERFVRADLATASHAAADHSYPSSAFGNIAEKAAI